MKIKTLIILTFLTISNLAIAETEEYKTVCAGNTIPNGYWGCIRYMPKTGKAWYIAGGIFMPIKDDNENKTGNYQIQMVQHGNDWAGFRTETNSGKVWQFMNTGNNHFIWEPVKELQQ